MILKYVNSQGTEIDFLSSYFRMKEADFSSYEWTYESTEQQYGIDISSFRKEAMQYEAVVAFQGTMQERCQNLNRFFEIVEIDILQKSPGKLYYGDYYLECYIIASSTQPEEKASRTLKTIQILAPHAFWIRTESRHFSDFSEISEEGLDFLYDFSYDFAKEKKGEIFWNTEHFTDSDFQMIISGPCADPAVTVNDHIYQIYVTLQDGEYIRLDSRDHTIQKYANDGTNTNIYDKRRKDQSVFKQMPGGILKIQWSGNFSFDLMLFYKRSEPLWCIA